MNPAIRFLLSVVSFLSMVDPALPDPAADAAGATDRVILEAGEVDSSTVAVDSYVVVIHGKGERNPVSGKWGRLETARGYVHSVDREVLTLLHRWDGRLVSIEVDRIQTLVLMGSHFRRVEAGDRMGTVEPIFSQAKLSSLRLGNVDSTQSNVEKKNPAAAPPAVSNSTERRKRTVDRLALFSISVIGGTLAGAELGPAILKEPEDCPEDGIFKCDVRDIQGGLFGFLAGSSIGIILASDLLDQVETPIKPDEAQRFSVGLFPTTRGCLLAVAALRF